MSFKRYISETRHKIKRKDINYFMSNPFMLFFAFIVLARGAFLRIIPQKSTFLFINQKLDGIIIPSTIENEFQFGLFDNITQEIIGYARKRCQEDNNKYFQRYLDDINKRFKNGGKACCILKNGEVLSILFLAYGREIISEIGFLYEAAAEEVMIKDIYTLKNGRKQGLYYLLINYTVNYISSLGFRSVTMWIMPHNKATIHAQMKIGFKETFMGVYHFTWLGIVSNKKKIVNLALKDL